jgi:endonuclease I
VARAWFYMAVRYQMPIDGRLEAVLRAWHEVDPPDPREMERNAGVDLLQRNRNPFVDRPGYVAYNQDF